MPDPSSSPKRRILLCSTVNGFTHAAPILELGGVLAARGHEVHFGTNSGQEHWESDYPSITRFHSFGPAMPNVDAEAPYARMIQWRPSHGVGSWNPTAKDTMIEFGVPIAVMWPQMPYLLAPVSYIPAQPGFSRPRRRRLQFGRVSGTRWSCSGRCRTFFIRFRWLLNRTILCLSTRSLDLNRTKTCLHLCKWSDRSWGMSTLHSMKATAFLKSHDKTVYVALGTHIALPEADLMKLLNALVMAIDAGYISGVIWSIGKSARLYFDRSAHVERTHGGRILVGEILNEKHPDIRLYLTQGGSSSANETLFHGTRTLILGFFFDQLANSARLVEAGVGLALDKFDFTTAEISEKVGRIVSDVDESFGRNVERMKRIARVASRRKEVAAGIVEEVIFDHELRSVGGRALRPMHLQTADMRMPVWKARNWDLWLVSVSILAVGCTTYFIGAKYARRLDLGIFRFVSGIPDIAMGISNELIVVRLGNPDVKTLLSACLVFILAYGASKVLKASWNGLTGPLAKIPGPWLNRFTALPWMVAVVRGKAFEQGINYNRKYGDIVRVAPDLVLVSDEKSVNQILVGMDLRKSVLYEKFSQNEDGVTLFTMRDRAQYRTRRRLFSHGFAISYLKGLEPLKMSCIGALEEFIDNQCTRDGGETVIDAWNLMGRLASDIMSATAFGGSFELVKNGEHPIRKKFSESFKRGTIYQLLPFLKYIPFLPKFRDPELAQLISDIIEKRQASTDKLAKPDLLQLLLDTHERNPETLSRIEVFSEMLVFWLAGSETTASTLTFAMMFLLNDPPSYQRLVNEIRGRFPLSNSPVSDDQTTDLPFLHAVLKETMRLAPPATGGLQRQTDEDVILSDHLIPAGTRVTANTTVLHWDEKQWPDAEKFVPERWLSDYKGMAASDKTAYYPFSAGSRNCIGKQFAWTELRLTLVSLLRRYDLCLIPNQSHELVHFTVLHLKAGKYMIGIRPRA
ncbi:cytochrome P450 [Colletotrichum scovillei]|nr:cytochrome P450 [Colletotrichum scovillei]KAF4784846.1 cytochrome P450 [Colletotrichum scovillei]